MKKQDDKKERVAILAERVKLLFGFCADLIPDKDLLKEGRLRTGFSTHLTIMGMEALLAALPKPPGAKALFIGDSSGGSGWEIELPNGETQKFYVQIPQGIPGVKITVNFHLAEAPEQLRRMPVPNLARHYFAQLKQLYDEARQQFEG